MNKTFEISIKGYWRESAINGIPSHSGIYFVYIGSYNASKDTVSLEDLIYIGEADNVKNRIEKHEKWKDWKKHLSTGQELIFSTGGISSTYRERVEAAYIYKHEPVENKEYKNSFPFDQTTVKSSGETALLDTDFTVYRDDN